jgi:hypothetical protein
MHDKANAAKLPLLDEAGKPRQQPANALCKNLVSGP